MNFFYFCIRMDFNFGRQFVDECFNQGFGTALFGVGEIKLMCVAVNRFAGGRAQNVFFRRFGNTVDHLRIHKAGIKFPDFFVVWPQIGVGNAFSESFQEKLKHILSVVIFIRVMQKTVDTVVQIFGRQFG